MSRQGIPRQRPIIELHDQLALRHGDGHCTAEKLSNGRGRTTWTWPGACPECGGDLSLSTHDDLTCSGCNPTAEGLLSALGVPGYDSVEGAAVPGTWQPVELSPLLAGIASGAVIGPRPALLRRSDGAALLYPGEAHIIAAEPESGKGWLMLAEAAVLLRAGRRVLYLDFEDTAVNVATRLLALGADPDTIASAFVYVRPEGAFTDEDLAALIARGPFALAVLDGIGEAYSILGYNYAANEDVPLFVRRLVRPLTEAGAAVVQIDHVTKAKEGRGRWAIGAQAKIASVAVAYGVEVIERPSREQAGRVRLVLAKDRHGNVAGQRGETVAIVHIVPDLGGDVVRVSVEPPTARDGFRPTVLMERVSRFVEASPSAGKRAIRDGVTGKAAAVDRAISCLIEEGFIEVEADGTATRHRSVRPFREADDVPPPCPRVPSVSQRVPGTLESDRVPVSPPLQGGTRDAGHAESSDGGRILAEGVPLDRSPQEGDTDPDLAVPFAWWEDEQATGAAA